MLQLFSSIYQLLSKKEKREFYFLSFIALLNALLQTVSVVSVLPFIAVVANPKMVETNQYLARLYNYFGFGSTTGFLIFLGAGVLFFLIVTNALLGFATFRKQYFIKDLQVAFEHKLLKRYLQQEYTFFLRQNSADLSKRVIEDARMVAERMMLSFLDLIVGALVSVFLLTMIILVDPILTLVLFGFMGGFYAIIFGYMRRKMHKLSYDKSIAMKDRLKTLGETFGAIKDIKLTGRESFFLSVYRTVNQTFADANAKMRLFPKIPPLIMDLLNFGSMILVVIYFLFYENNLSVVLPILTLYAITAHRLKPQVQVIFTSLTNINFTKASLDFLLTDLEKLPALPTKSKAELKQKDPFLAFRNIDIRQLSFNYPGREETVLDQMNLQIDANQTIALVGASGSGKTTLVDLILGILKPSKGQVSINNTALDQENLSFWQRHIGYIPQHIFLFDDTIANNIAFTEADEAIDHKLLQEVIRTAELEDFIAELPQGIHSMVGDKGVRLSGGQRQRIGIARALYRKPSLLVMDEATSALDGITEELVINSIYRLSGKLTIIMIAHRLTTVKNCDCIHLLEDGKLVQSGTYEELIASNPTFRSMAKEPSLSQDSTLQDLPG